MGNCMTSMMEGAGERDTLKIENEDDLTFAEPDSSDPSPKRGTAVIIQNKKFTGQRLAVINGQVKPSTANDQTVQWCLVGEKDGFVVLQCSCPGGPYNLRIGERDEAGYELAVDNRDSNENRWRLMPGKDGWYALVNKAQVLHRLQMRDAKTFGAGRAALTQQADDYMFHFIDLDPFDQGKVSLEDAAAKCQKLLGIRMDQLDRNNERATEAVNATRRMADTSAALKKKYRR